MVSTSALYKRGISLVIYINLHSVCTAYLQNVSYTYSVFQFLPDSIEIFYFFLYPLSYAKVP
jgi:hypothetical protein